MTHACRRLVLQCQAAEVEDKAKITRKLNFDRRFSSERVV